MGLQLQQIPALAGAAPDHRSVVVMHPAALAVGSGFRMGHHRLDRDVVSAPAPAAGNGRHLQAEAVELRRCGRLGPGVGLTAHAGAGEGDAVAVAPPGVGGQIRREGMQPMHTAIAADDPVVTPGADPVVAGGRPVQIDRCRHNGGSDSPPSVQTQRHDVSGSAPPGRICAIPSNKPPRSRRKPGIHPVPLDPPGGSLQATAWTCLITAPNPPRWCRCCGREAS